MALPVSAEAAVSESWQLFPRDHDYKVGTLLNSFVREREARLRLSQASRPSGWMSYNGGEIAPFEAYMRWGRDRDYIVLSNINSASTKQGRMPLIMAALESMASVVDVESVVNPFLQRWLERRGYRPIMDGPMPPAYPANYRRIAGTGVVDFYEARIYGYG